MKGRRIPIGFTANFALAQGIRGFGPCTPDSMMPEERQNLMVGALDGIHLLGESGRSVWGLNITLDDMPQ